MPGNPAPLRFDNLRTWDGTQSRAFEELAFQLLKDDVPANTRAIRTAAPDGGVEWYATLPDGSEWGWQAKHIHDFDALLGAMTDSVRRVALERPQLRTLTFVISSNLSTGTSGRQRLSQRQKYENKIASWQKGIAGAQDITFDLVQESDLADKLASPQHRGRVWFWWGQPNFDRTWLHTRYEEQARAAGDKYRPDLQVDVPIELDLQALGFDDSVLQEFYALTSRTREAVRDCYFREVQHDKLATALKAAQASAEQLFNAIDVVLTVDKAGAILDSVKMALSACVEAIGEAQELESELEAEWKKLPKDLPNREELKPPDTARDYRLRRLRDLCHELDAWLQSTVGRSLESGLYFLSGPAGSGKTHLLLDAVKRSLGAERPAVFLAGARFGRADLWTSICDQLGLSPVGADQLLGAMDSAGEASGLSGRRFVICIDALNETPESDFWRTHLPTLRATIRPWPHVALVVSCRDTYAEVVDDGTERTHYTRRSHPGFAGREIEASQKYFEHYGLEAPRIPLLTPEFTLPLFLRLYCESLRDTNDTSYAAGHEGRIRIFERYLNAKVAFVSRRVRPNVSTAFELDRARDLVARAIDALVDEFVDTGKESMPVARAESLLSSLSNPREVSALLGNLQSEGILTREILYFEDADREGVRIVFQAFSDYLILRRRMERASHPLGEDGGFKQWLGDEASWGILEAAAVILPEVEGEELPDFLDLNKADLLRPNPAEEDKWRRHLRTQHVYESLIETLPYRESSAITQRTIDHLNDVLRSGLPADRFFQILFTISPQPNNRLNGDGLHSYLLKFRMPTRDSWFGFATYYELSEESSSASRLAQWASAGPYPTYDPKVVELASIPLVWLFSSPNRFMRDWVTKSLVQLLKGHLDVVDSLIRRFWDVNDPYVVQRVIVTAYGALMWSDPKDREHAKAVVKTVRRLVFSKVMRPDELMLDAARGIVEWGAKHGLISQSTARKATRRPYGFKVPGAPPTQEKLKSKYGYREDRRDNESYSSLWFSLFSMGDFGRYVVESGVHHFSRYRLGEDFPERDHPQARLVKSKWHAFEKSLTDQQRKQLEGLEKDPDLLRFSRWLPGRNSLDLSEEQWALLDASWVYPKRRVRDDDYPAERGKRWILRRVLSLGWTPQLFGEKDRQIGNGIGREEHKAERWGKKYQWIAYHELLARVADNYQPSRRYSDYGPYEGLYQLTADREIDPSLPPISFRDFSERRGADSPTWRPPTVSFPEWPPGQLNFAPYRGELEPFLLDEASEPRLVNVLRVADSENRDWVVLDAYLDQSDPSAPKRWRGLQQLLSIDTWLTPAPHSAQLLKKLQRLRRHGHDLIDTHGHTDCCYFGEIGWVKRSCYHRHAEWVDYGEDEPIRLVPTTETYAWEGSLLDCSIGQTVFSALPSTFFQERSDLRFDVHGPSWSDSGGVAFINQDKDREGYDRALLVRADWLSEFLNQHDLVLVAGAWFERRHLGADPSGPHAYKSGYLASSFDGSGRIREIEPNIERDT